MQQGKGYLGKLKVGTDMSVHLYQKFRGLTNDLNSSGNF